MDVEGFREWAICTVLVILCGIFGRRTYEGLEHEGRIATLFHHRGHYCSSLSLVCWVGCGGLLLSCSR